MDIVCDWIIYNKYTIKCLSHFGCDALWRRNGETIKSEVRGEISLLLSHATCLCVFNSVPVQLFIKKGNLIGEIGT